MSESAVSVAPAIETTNTSTTPAETASPEVGTTSHYEKWLKERGLEGSTKKPQTIDEVTAKEPEKKEAKAEKSEKVSDKEKTDSVGKIKVNGKEYTEPEINKAMTDLENTVSDNKKQFEEINSTIDKFLHKLRTDPGELFDKIGITRDAIEKYYMEKYVEPSKLTAEQKLQKMEDEKAENTRKAVEQQKAQERAQSQEYHRQQYLTQISGAIKEAGLPETDWVVSRMAGYMQLAMQNKQSWITPKDIAPLVEQDLIKLQTSSLVSLPADKIVARLGEDVIKKIREHDTKNLKAGKFENTNPGTGTVERKEKKGKRITSVYDMLD